MKLTRLFIACAMAACTALLANSLSAAEGPVKFADGRAVVRSLTGTAEYKELNQSEYKKLNINAILKPGTTVKTAAGSQVDLFLGENGPVVRVTPASELTLDRLAVGDAGSEGKVIETKLNLANGSILGNVKKLAKTSTYEVKIPNGVCAIRGTQFQVSAGGQLTVIEGSVAITFTPPGGVPQTVTVPAGQTFVPPGPGSITITAPVPTGSAVTPEVLATINVNVEGVATIVANPGTTITVDPVANTATVVAPDGTVTTGTAGPPGGTGGTPPPPPGGGGGTVVITPTEPTPPVKAPDNLVFKVAADGKVTVIAGTIKIGNNTYTKESGTITLTGSSTTIIGLAGENGLPFSASGTPLGSGVVVAIVHNNEGTFTITIPDPGTILPVTETLTDRTVEAQTPVIP